MKQQFLTTEQTDANIASFQKAMDLLTPQLHEQVTEKLLDGVTGQEYFEAPASAKADYHSCFPGGLLHHSLKVTRNLHKIIPELVVANQTKSWITFAGMFHDIGKCGDGENSYYVEQDSDWHREKLGQYYTYNEEVKYMVVAQRSLYLIQRAGIVLPFDVYQAILLHDGYILEGNRSYCLKEKPLASALQSADYLATIDEKQK